MTKVRLDEVLPRPLPASIPPPPIVCQGRPKKGVPAHDTWHHFTHDGDGWYIDDGLCAKAEYHKQWGYPWEHEWSDCDQ